MKRVINIFIIVVFIFRFGCKKDDFDPVIGFYDNMAVMGILNNWSGTQYIKIQKMYNSLKSSDSSKVWKNLSVNIIENSSVVYNFRDTIIEGITNYGVYYNKDLKIKRGISYTLQITDNNNPAVYAIAVAPSHRMSLSKLKNNILLKYYNIYEYHIYILYQQKINNIWTDKKMEVPVEMNISHDLKDTIIIYPSFMKPKYSELDSISIPNTNMTFTLSKVYASAEKENLRAIKCCLFFETPDLNLYAFLAHGFNDKYSVRLDQPDFTNILNGDGIFGIISLDSLEIFSAAF
jgi:hypothetical protein